MVIKMKRFLYMGDLSPVTINILDSRYYLEKGDILELEDRQAEQLKTNYNFKEMGVRENKEKKKEKIIVNMDLNRDGTIDAKDASIAGKVLNTLRKK